MTENDVILSSLGHDKMTARPEAPKLDADKHAKMNTLIRGLAFTAIQTQRKTTHTRWSQRQLLALMLFRSTAPNSPPTACT